MNTLELIPAVLTFFFFGEMYMWSPGCFCPGAWVSYGFVQCAWLYEFKSLLNQKKMMVINNCLSLWHYCGESTISDHKFIAAHAFLTIRIFLQLTALVNLKSWSTTLYQPSIRSQFSIYDKIYCIFFKVKFTVFLSYNNKDFLRSKIIYGDIMKNNEILGQSK